MLHSRRSPSKAKRTIHCPGGQTLIESLPPELQNVATESALLGTATHGLIEHVLSKDEEPEQYRDRIIELRGEDDNDLQVVILKPGAKMPKGKFFIIDDFIIDGATVMTDYVRARCLKFGIPIAKVQLESRTNPLPERDDTDGTADVTIDAWPILLEVVDYKNGWNVVEHRDNDQLSSYLAGKAEETGFSHERYQITVVQPNAPHEEGAIRPFEMTAAEIKDFQRRYRVALKTNDEADNAKDRPRNVVNEEDIPAKWAKRYLAAGDHCLFCDAQPVCPAKRMFAQSEAKLDFASPPTEQEAPRDVHSAAEILNWAPMIEDLISRARAFVHQALENGYEAPGQKLVRGKSNRKLREDMTPAQIAAAILKGGFIAAKSKAAMFKPSELKSGPQLEKLVPKEKRDRFNKKFLVKPEGRLTVAPEDDPRPAVVRSAADDFADDAEDFG